MTGIEQFAAWLREAQRITVLTGAGISTASGIPDFRSRGGLYDTKLPLERILSEDYYDAEPEAFWQAFKQVFGLLQYREYRPNDGHDFLRELEQAGKHVTIVTQNVDGLHRAAGSEQVYEAHGTVAKAFCPQCGAGYDAEHVNRSAIPICEHDGAVLKPDVVLFGGAVRHMEEAADAARNCDVFLAIGTSLEVYPVSGLPDLIRCSSGIRKVILNRDPTRKDHLFELTLHEDITAVVREVRKLL